MNIFTPRGCGSWSRLPRVPPDFDQVSGRPDQEERVVTAHRYFRTAAESSPPGPPGRPTRHWPLTERTVVLGSVIMKKMKSGNMGPVIGPTAAPRAPAREPGTDQGEDEEGDTHRSREMWRRPSFLRMKRPKAPNHGHGPQGNCPIGFSLSTAVRWSVSSMAQIPKLEGFQRWRPLTRRTYFEVIESRLPSAYGHMAGERTRIPTLMPET